jgi:hypothetical protein
VIIHSLKTRILALFVTIFVCLNGAGAACVAYCQTMDAPEQTADHCPLKKLSEHCDKAGGEPPSQASAQSSDFDCCPMTVSFFAGPIEKNSFSVKQPATAEVIKAEVFRSGFRSITPLRLAISYRGPPPLDRRPDRIKHRVLLI